MFLDFEFAINVQKNVFRTDKLMNDVKYVHLHKLMNITHILKRQTSMNRTRNKFRKAIEQGIDTPQNRLIIFCLRRLE